MFFKGEDFLIRFGPFLAERIERMKPRTLSPEGFHTASLMALYDLQRSKDGTKSPEESINPKTGLLNYPHDLYDLMQNRIPDIARAVASESFAKKVKAIVESYKRE